MGIKVLSLFDGMSCGQIALQRGGIKVSQYFASEIHEPSIKVTQKNYPNTIQIGDVRKISYKKGYLTYKDRITEEMKTIFVGKIHMILAGSPCQDLSRSNTKGGGLDGTKSGLFFEFLRILKEVNPDYFLLENVVPRNKNDKNIIDKALGVKGVSINSRLVSAQDRERIYWTNINVLYQPVDKNIMFKDIAYDGEHKPIDKKYLPRIRKTMRQTKGRIGYIQFDFNGNKNNSMQDRLYHKDGKMGTLSTTCGSTKIIEDMEKEEFRRLHIIEAERLQNVKGGYTDVEGISMSDRFGMLGNGWTVDVITHIFSFMNFERLYSNDEEMQMS
jgi:site-specific DNA-cytosine methylase